MKRSIFLISISLLLINSFINSAHPKKKPHKKETESDFFIIRFQSTGDEKADKEFEKMFEDKPEKVVFLANLITKSSKKSYRLSNFEKLLKLDNDIIVPIKYNNTIIESISFTIGREVGQDRVWTTYAYTGCPLFKVQSGKKYIFRFRKCNDIELKNSNKFVAVPLNISSFRDHPFKNSSLNFCVEIQDIAEQQKKLKEELEQALPDMPGDLRNIIQSYVGTDIT